MTAKEFKTIRKKLGLTQVEMGRRLIVTKQTIYNYERDMGIPGAVQILMRQWSVLS